MESDKVVELSTGPKLSRNTKILLLEAKNAVLDSTVTWYNVEKQTEALRTKFIEILQNVLKEYPGYQFDLSFNLIKIKGDKDVKDVKTIPD